MDRRVKKSLTLGIKIITLLKSNVFLKSNAMSSTGKITGKGQITIPRDMRKILGTDIVEFEAAGENVILKPVRSVGGSLGKYTRRPAPFDEVRGEAWESVIRDKKKK